MRRPSDAYQQDPLSDRTQEPARFLINRKASASRSLDWNLPAKDYRNPKKQIPMLGYTILFLIISLIAGALGFRFISGTAAYFAKVLFVIFLILFLISLIRGGSFRF